MNEENKMDIWDRIMQLPVLRIFEPLYARNKEILLYLFFGGITVVLSVSIYAIQTQCMKISALVANAVAWIICVVFQFFTNKICPKCQGLRRARSRGSAKHQLRY